MLPSTTPLTNILRRLTGPLLLSFGLAAFSLVLFAWLAEEVGEGATRYFDAAIRSAVHGLASPLLTECMRMLSLIGSVLVSLVLGGLITGWLWWKQFRRHAIVLASTLLGAVMLNSVLKQVFHRPRPAPFFETPLPASYSFPSGHALFSVCMYLTVASIFAVLDPRRKVAIWASAILLILGIGFSRIYLGVHYPSDVAAGYLAGFVWVSAVQAFARPRSSNNEPKVSGN